MTSPTGIDDFPVAAYEADSDGRWISTAFRQLAQVINDYDPDMFLSWIEPHLRQPEDTHPFCVVQCLGGRQKVLFFLTEQEMENREEVLARIFRGDQRKNDVFGDIKKSQAAAELLRLKAKQEKQEAARDFALSVMKSPKHSYVHDGRRYR